MEILRMKIAENKKIRIIGDYDIDGVTATCILLKGLKRSGGTGWIHVFLTESKTDMDFMSS